MIWKYAPLLTAVIFAAVAGCTLGVFLGQLGTADASAYLSFAGAVLGTSGAVWGAFAVVRYGAAREQTEVMQILIQILFKSRTYIYFLQDVQNARPSELPDDEKNVLIDTAISVFINSARYINEERLAQRTRNARVMFASFVFTEESRRVISSFERCLADRNRSRDSSGVKVDKLKISPSALSAARTSLNRFLNTIYDLPGIKARVSDPRTTQDSAESIRGEGTIR